MVATINEVDSSVGIENETCPLQIDSEIYNIVTSAHSHMLELNTSTMIAYLNENNNIESTRNYIYKYYMDTFNLYYSLYDNIKDEYFWDHACHLRWPIGWYSAHVASFYMNKLRMNNYIKNRTNNDLYIEYDYIFAQGTDEMDWFDFVPQHPKEYWPNVLDVKKYIIHTRDIIVNIILTAPLMSLPINKSVIWWPILMGIEHERIHLETSAMLMRQLPLYKFKDKINERWNNDYPTESLNNINNIPPNNELISVYGTSITYGKSSNLLNSSNDFFGWDAETGCYTVNITNFNASKYMVSNYEFYEFYVNNGYINKEYWSAKGWEWVLQTNTTHPKFWVIENIGNNINIKLRNLFSEIDMFYGWNRPIICNKYEADAFLKFKSNKLNKSLRLITEDEWYLLRTMNNNNNKNIRELSEENTNNFIGNINFYYFTSEAPINIFQFGDSNFYDIIGNVWHHTISHYHPFNNYEIDPLYVDFSSPFFNNSYFLMKGGSYLSSGNMAMIYNRCQWFRSHYFQAAGIRYVESNRIDINSVNNNKKTTKEYFKDSDESDELCNECIHLQYTQSNYKQIIIDIINKYITINDTYNILDIGCSVGALTYELAKHAYTVTGIDDRARFIGIANQIQQNKKLEYYWNNKYYHVTLNELENISHKIKFVHNNDLNYLFFNNENNVKYDLIIGENMERYYNQLKHTNNTYKLSNLLNKNGAIILFENYETNLSMDEINLILGSKLKLKHQFQQNYENIQQQYSLHCTIWEYL